ncbi:M1 family metallopeptidase [Candidatus Saccharibacteria bacterium]|nr:M1 family metallopeptidase [Candidatus Saccharibacteria bacterium]
MERFLEYFVPEKYRLDLAIDKVGKTIGGVVEVQGKALTETVKFHAVNMSVERVLVNDEKCDFKVKDGVLTLDKISLGEAKVLIEYEGQLNENMQGAYLSTYEYEGKTETIVATQFESHYAREAFPCIDEPAAKAVFELTITASEEDIVLSNMPEMKFSSAPRRSRPSPRGERANSRAAALRNAPNQISVSGRKTIIFEPTPRMSTYLLAWVVGKLHGKTVTNQHGVEITTYTALNQDVDSVDFANEVAARSLEFYDDNFGIDYPLKKLDQVALPDFDAGAMENWGLVTYRESMLLVSKDATLGARKSVALTVAHELSHQWFGDLVTMKWWDDLWLNESFASVMEYYAVDAIYPEFKIWESFFTGDCAAALNRDAYSGVQSVHQEVHDPEEITTLFDGAIVYAKGARLMLMLIRLMGWMEFCKGIHEYFEKYKYENTVGDDLWTCLKPYATFDPGELMHAFIDRPGYPIVTNTGVDFDKFTQKRFLLDGEMPESDWPLPEIREDMSGHYILNLSDAEFEERLKRFDKLGLEEKLRLLMDRDLITRAGVASPASLVPLVMKFKDESAAAVWNKLASLVGNLKVYFDDESEEEKKLKRYVYELVDGKLKEVGMETRKGDDENMIRLRANLMALDYFAEDEERFKELAARYTEDYSKMDAEVRDAIIGAKVYLEPEFVDECLKKYQEVSDPDVKFDYLAAACLVRNEKELDKLMALLGENEIVKPQDQLYLFVYLYRNPKCRAKAFEWLVNNWETVKRINGDKALDSYPTVIAKLARTKEEYDAYVDFFKPMENDSLMARAVKIGVNEIKARLELIEKHQQEVKEVLEQRVKVGKN